MIVPTLVLLGQLGGPPECVVERSFWPCIDLLEVVWICMDDGYAAETVHCLESAAALWDVPYTVAATAARVLYYECDVDDERGPCVDLWASCEQPDGQFPICLAVDQEACEDQAWVGSNDAAGLVCCAALGDC